MNLAGHRVQRLSGYYFEPWFSCSSLPAMGLLVNLISYPNKLHLAAQYDK